MQWSGWINFSITAALFVAFVVALVYYYNPKRQNKVEGPKYRMLDDDDETTSPKGSEEDDKKER